MDTTVCEGDSATFSCVFFLSIGAPSAPAWLRNDVTVDMMRHIVTNNLTDGASAPVTFSSTVIVSNVTVDDDNGVSYECGIGSTLTNNATLKVIGKYFFHDSISLMALA